MTLTYSDFSFAFVRIRCLVTAFYNSDDHLWIILSESVPSPLTPRRMPSIRLTLVNNAKQTQVTVVLIPSDKLDLPAIEQVARSKLRLKKLVHIFHPSGQPLTDIAQLQNGDKLILSQGEAFVGNKSSLASDTPAAKQVHHTTRQSTSAPVRLIANKAQVTPEAVKQLHAVAQLPGMSKVVGLPDLHAGQQSPIGAAYICTDRVYPALVDQDIGCGMTLYATAVKADISPDRLAKELYIEGPYHPTPSTCELRDLPSGTLGSVDFDHFLQSLGSIGGGNHFAEFQTLEKIVLPEARPSNLSQDRLFLLVHSGSRGLGKAILQAQPNGALSEGTPEFSSYMRQHDAAVQWAKLNRQTIAERLLACLDQDLDATTEKVLDLVHNCVVKVPEGWLHRKGAAPSQEEGQLGLIPGSRGHRTWMVRVKGPQSDNGGGFEPGSFFMSHAAPHDAYVRALPLRLLQLILSLMALDAPSRAPRPLSWRLHGATAKALSWI